MKDADAKKILEKKILLLQGYLDDLQSYLTLSNDQILGNKDKLLSTERLFQLVADEAADINSVIAYQLGGQIPDSFKSSFYELVPLKVIEHSFAEQIMDSVKVRNQLTHDYEKLSKTETLAAIRRFFDMYKTYAKILIEKFLKEN